MFGIIFQMLAVELISRGGRSLGGEGYDTLMLYLFVLRRDEETCGLCSDTAQCLIYSAQFDAATRSGVE